MRRGVTKPRFVTACQPELRSTRARINVSDKKTKQYASGVVFSTMAFFGKNADKITNTFFVMKYQDNNGIRDACSIQHTPSNWRLFRPA